MQMFRWLYWLFQWFYWLVRLIVTRVVILASGMDTLLKVSRWFGWESVPHWPLVRFYNPERYAPYVGLSGGWSPIGSWHNSFVLGGFCSLMLAFGGLVGVTVIRALQKDGLSLEDGSSLPEETLARIRPVARSYFVWIFLASVGSVVALWSPEIFGGPKAVPPSVQLLLGACLASVATDELTFIFAEDLKKIAQRASWF